MSYSNKISRLNNQQIEGRALISVYLKPKKEINNINEDYNTHNWSMTWHTNTCWLRGINCNNIGRILCSVLPFYLRSLLHPKRNKKINASFEFHHGPWSFVYRFGLAVRVGTFSYFVGFIAPLLFSLKLVTNYLPTWQHQASERSVSFIYSLALAPVQPPCLPLLVSQ